ncbi:hypothetical protein BDEG_26155 [Batrachochytrium dendrobatidis JEL423]|nr:hypothetical protein BDEG_26155 [Batrachochytrium dendrobatidis JEL423]
MKSVIVARMTVAAYLLFQSSKECTPMPWLSIYLILCIVTFIVETIILATIGVISLRGSIADDRPRRPVVPFIYTFIATVVLETVLHIFGLSKFYTEATYCRESNIFNAGFVIVIYCFLTGVLIFAISLTLQLAVGSSTRSIEHMDSPQFWQYCLIPFVCFPLYIRGYSRSSTAARAGRSTRTTTILSDVAELFTELFGDVRLVPSDILAGLILVKRADKRKKREQQQHEIVNIAMDRFEPLISIHNPPIHRDWNYIVHYYKFTEAIYGFPLYMLTHFFDGFRHLCCPCTGSKPHSAINAVQMYMDSGWSNGCLCCFPASCCYSKPCRHDDLIHISITNELFKSPFMVCFDHDTASIVVSIRGTLSTTDLLVDLHFRLAEIRIPSDSGDVVIAQTHYGMLRTAKNIFEELKRTDLFSILLSNVTSAYSNYRLVCTGHSLGGGVAALVAFLIKTSAQYKNLESRVTAIAYSPPGCMITAKGQDYFKTFCTSVVFGNDVIPRLKMHSVCTLKQQVISELGRCNHSHKLDLLTGKMMKPMIRACQNLGGFYDHRTISSTSPTHTDQFIEQQTHPTIFNIHNDATNERLGEANEETSSNDSASQTPTYLPGHILHIRRVEKPILRRQSSFLFEDGDLPDDQTNTNVGTDISDRSTTYTICGSEYELVWSPPEAFDSILISKTMGLDHMPNRLGSVLASLKLLKSDSE